MYHDLACWCRPSRPDVQKAGYRKDRLNRERERASTGSGLHIGIMLYHKRAASPSNVRARSGGEMSRHMSGSGGGRGNRGQSAVLSHVTVRSGFGGSGD